MGSTQSPPHNKRPEEWPERRSEERSEERSKEQLGLAS
jgi:hypothetical protein